MRVGVCVISRLTSHLLQFASTRVDFNLSCHQQYNIVVVYSLPASPIFKKRRSWSNQFHVCLLECLNTLNIESSIHKALAPVGLVMFKWTCQSHFRLVCVLRLNFLQSHKTHSASSHFSLFLPHTYTLLFWFCLRWNHFLSIVWNILTKSCRKLFKNENWYDEFLEIFL